MTFLVRRFTGILRGRQADLLHEWIDEAIDIKTISELGRYGRKAG